MPKDKPPYRLRHRNKTSKEERLNYTNRAIIESLKIDFRYRRYEEKGLRYFVETKIGRYARCIIVSTNYSLFILEEE